MALQIAFHGLSRSDAIEQYVRKRVAKLDTLADRITSCRVALEMPHRHAHRGGHYRVRVAVTRPGGEVVVSRSPDAAKTYEDLYAVIGAAFDEIGRQLQDLIRRRREDVKVRRFERRKTFVPNARFAQA
jgi:putative sigma-54 modulation protein